MPTKTYPVVELLGDGIGPELSDAVHFLADKALPFRIEWRSIDLSVASRGHRGTRLYDEAIDSR